MITDQYRYCGAGADLFAGADAKLFTRSYVPPTYCLLKKNFCLKIKKLKILYDLSYEVGHNFTFIILTFTACNEVFCKTRSRPTQRNTQRNATLYATQRNATQRYTYNTCLIQTYIFDVSTLKTIFIFLKQNIHLTVCVLSVELYLEKPFFF